MFKLVVLCVFAAAVAEPEPSTLLYGSAYPYAAYSSIISPATTTITKSSSLIAHPSPALYSAPLVYSHFIKKRSADAEPEPEPQPNPEPEPKPQIPLAYTSSLYYPSALQTPYISNPFYSGYAAYPYQASLPLATTHLIKKRSAQFLETPYLPTTYAVPSYNPYYPTTYLGSKLYSEPASSVVIPHFIKKRSVAALPLTTAYATPYTSTYLNNYYPAGAIPTTYFGNSYYAAPGVISQHLIKKRDAPLLTAPTFIAPTTYTAATSPLLTTTYSAASPLLSSIPYVASPYAYSTFIKK